MRHGAAGGAVHGGWYPLSLRRMARRAGEELCDAGGRARSRLPHSRGRGLWETRPCWENQEGRRRNSERELGGTGSRLDGDCPDGRRDCRKVRTAEGFRETDEPWWRLSRHDTGPGFGLRDLNQVQVLRDGKASQVKVSSGLAISRRPRSANANFYQHMCRLLPLSSRVAPSRTLCPLLFIKTVFTVYWYNYCR